MKKRFIAVIFIITLLTTLSACNKNDVNAKIQLWYYDFKNDQSYIDYMKEVKDIVNSAKKFSEENDIPLEIVKYNAETMSHEDYILKRNIAAASGNIIIIEDINFLHTLAKWSADYSKLDSYKNLLNAYKNRFCIPLRIRPIGFHIDNRVLDYYGIDTSGKSIITYAEYLKIKQDIMKLGARFELDYREYVQMIEAHLSENGLLIIDAEDEIFKNIDNFKGALKKTIIGVCNDIASYYDRDLSLAYGSSDYEIDEYMYDKNSQLPFKLKTTLLQPITDPYMFKGDDIENKIFVAYYKYWGSSPFFYMYKKITNNRIYELANHIISESNYAKTLDNYKIKYRYPSLLPLYNTEEIRKEFRVDENWKFNTYEDLGKSSEIIKKLVSDAYEVLVLDDEKSKEIVDCYYSNADYMSEIEWFIRSTIDSVAHEISGDQLTLKSFDSNDEKVNKLIDEKIDEFINNFNVHYK